MSFDRTRIAVGDNVRDNQSMQDGRVIDVRPLKDLSIVSVVVWFERSGLRKDYQIKLSDMAHELGGGPLSIVRKWWENSPDPEVPAAASQAQNYVVSSSQRFDDPAVKPGWGKLRLFVEQTYNDANVETFTKTELVEALKTLEKSAITPDELQTQPLHELMQQRLPSSANKVAIIDLIESLVKTKARWMFGKEGFGLIRKRVRSVEKHKSGTLTSYSLGTELERTIQNPTLEAEALKEFRTYRHGSVETQLEKAGFIRNSLHDKVLELRNQVDAVRSAGYTFKNSSIIDRIAKDGGRGGDIMWAYRVAQKYAPDEAANLLSVVKQSKGDVHAVTSAAQLLSEKLIGRQVAGNVGGAHGGLLGKVRKTLDRQENRLSFVQGKIAEISMDNENQSLFPMSQETDGGYNFYDNSDYLDVSKRGLYNSYEALHEGYTDTPFNQSVAREPLEYTIKKQIKYLAKNPSKEAQAKSIKKLVGLSPQIQMAAENGKPLRTRHAGMLYNITGVGQIGDVSHVKVKPANVIGELNNSFVLKTSFTTRREARAAILATFMSDASIDEFRELESIRVGEQTGEAMGKVARTSWKTTNGEFNSLNDLLVAGLGIKSSRYDRRKDVEDKIINSLSSKLKGPARDSVGEVYSRMADIAANLQESDMQTDPETLVKRLYTKALGGGDSEALAREELYGKTKSVDSVSYDAMNKEGKDGSIYNPIEQQMAGHDLTSMDPALKAQRDIELRSLYRKMKNDVTGVSGVDKTRFWEIADELGYLENERVKRLFGGLSWALNMKEVDGQVGVLLDSDALHAVARLSSETMDAPFAEKIFGLFGKAENEAGGKVYAGIPVHQIVHIADDTNSQWDGWHFTGNKFQGVGQSDIHRHIHPGLLQIDSQNMSMDKIFALDDTERMISPDSLRKPVFGMTADSPEFGNLLSQVNGNDLPIYRYKGGGGLGSTLSPDDFARQLTNTERALKGQSPLLALDIETQGDRILNIGMAKAAHENGEYSYKGKGFLDIGTEDLTKKNLPVLNVEGGVHTPGTMASSEHDMLKQAASYIQEAGDDSLILTHNSVFDLPKLAKRSKQLGLDDTAKVFQQASTREVDTLMITKMIKRQLAGGYSLENIARKLEARMLGWSEEHVGLFDARTAIQVLNKLIGERDSILDANGNIGIFETGPHNIPSRMSATPGSYYWNVRERRLYNYVGWKAGDSAEDPISLVMKEVNGQYRVESMVGHTAGERFSGQYEQVTEQQGKALSESAAEDYSRNRVRKLLYDVDAPYREMELIQGAHGSAIPRPQNYSSTSEYEEALATYRRSVKNGANLHKDPRMAEQLKRTSEWIQNEFEPVHKEIYDKLAADTTLSHWEKNAVLKDWHRYADKVAPWQRNNIDKIPAFDRKLSFTMPEYFGKEAQSIRLATPQLMNEDILAHSMAIAGRMDEAKLHKILGSVMDAKDISRFAKSRDVKMLSEQAADTLVESIKNNELLSGIQRNRTEMAMRISGAEDFSKMEGNALFERLGEIGQMKNLDAANRSLLETAAFNDYNAGRVAGREGVLTRARDRFLSNMDGQMDNILERQIDSSNMLMGHDFWIDDAMKGKSLARTFETFTNKALKDGAERPEKTGKWMAFNFLGKIVNDEDRFSALNEEQKNWILDKYGWSSFQEGQDLSKLHDAVVPNGAHTGKKIGELSSSSLQELASQADTMPSQFRNILNKTVGPNVGFTSGDLISPGFASKFTNVTSLLEDVGHNMEAGKNLVKKNWVVAGALAVGALAFAARTPDTRTNDQDQPNELPVSTENRAAITQESSLFHRISVRIHGDTDKHIPESEVTESIQSALAKHLKGNMVDPTLSVSDRRQKVDNKTVDTLSERLLKGR